APIGGSACKLRWPAASPTQLRTMMVWEMQPCVGCPCAVLVLRSWDFRSSRQNHALDQRVRDVGRMSQDGRPLVVRHQLRLPADRSVSQWPQLLDQPNVVRARAKVERPLWHRSGWAGPTAGCWGGGPTGGARGGRRIDRVGRIQPIV